jgi:hypothetical protein
MEHCVTQRLSISVQNDLTRGKIIVKNTIMLWYSNNITVQKPKTH